MPPRRSRSQTPEDAAIRSFTANFDLLTKRSAASLGQPPGTRPVGDVELVRQWGIRDNKVDRLQLLAQLLTTGLPQELLDQNNPQAFAIMKAAPDLAPLYGQPVTDHEVAEILTGLAEWPFRYGILAAIDDPEDQVKEANRLDGLWQKKVGTPPEPPTLTEPLAQVEGAQTQGPPAAMPQPPAAPPMAPNPQQMAPAQLMGG